MSAEGIPMEAQLDVEQETVDLEPETVDPVQEVVDPEQEDEGFSEDVTLCEGQVQEIYNLYILGANACGQLGVDPHDVDILEFPALCNFFESRGTKVVSIAAGGMHSCVVTADGSVFTFGCNDDGALGRPADPNDDAACSMPGQVELPGKAIQVSAGDSHTAALLEDGTVYCWGTFRDEGNLPYGLLPSDCDAETENDLFHREPVKLPLKPTQEMRIQSIASGDNHMTLLTRKGRVMTFGAWFELLGRPLHVTRRNFKVEGRIGEFGKDKLEVTCKLDAYEMKKINLTPTAIFGFGKQRFQNVWTGAHCTFCKEKITGRIWAFGMNSTSQLGIVPKDENEVIHGPVNPKALDNSFVEISVGKFHCLALNDNGEVFSWGQPDQGQLGLADDTPEGPTAIPTKVEALDERVTSVNCGNSVSYVVTESENVYAWGSGVNWQLAHSGDDEDASYPRLVLPEVHSTVPIGRVREVNAGGQHTLLLLRDDTPMDTS